MPKKQAKQGAKWLDRALFVSPIHYALCVTEEQFHVELERLEVPRGDWPPFRKNKHAGATTHFFEEGGGKECAVVTIQPPDPEKIEPIQVAALLVHEAVHIWQEVRDRIGERKPSDEFEAYSVQWLAQELMYAYKELAVDA